MYSAELNNNFLRTLKNPDIDFRTKTKVFREQYTLLDTENVPEKNWRPTRLLCWNLKYGPSFTENYSDMASASSGDLQSLKKTSSKILSLWNDDTFTCVQSSNGYFCGYEYCFHSKNVLKPPFSSD